MDSTRVLVVDDDDAIRNLMAHHLRRRGYDVDSARDGVEGLERLQSAGPFAVLVTDLMMPRMNGLDLLRKARQVDPQLETIVVTASATADTAVAAMREDGAFDYLTKPLETVGELSVVVAKAMSHRQLRLERNALHERLSAEAERLGLLVANIGDAILSADASGCLTVANPAACDLLGQSELVGADALTALPRPFASLVANWQAVGDRRPTVMEMSWPAGSTQMVSLSPLEGGAGGAGGWVMVIRDITHLKQMDELKMRMLTETAGRIQLPLAQAMATLSALDDPSTMNGERAAAVVYRLVNVWHRIQEWTEDVLALVRYEAGDGMQSTRLDVGPLVGDTVLHFEDNPRLKTKDLRLAVDLSAGLPLVRTDPDLMRKVLHGLVSRAALRSQPGGTIALTARAENGQVWIEVGDDGPPVTESELPHLFDRSFADSSRGYASTGLELALVKTIVDRSGGQVWVSGRGSVGSAIAVCLPAAADDETDDRTAGAESPAGIMQGATG